MDPFVGEVRMFAGNFAPAGWLFCNGQLLNISQYDVLFSLLGTTYGGDGNTTFALPDLRGRTPIHAGQGPDRTNRFLGQALGSEKVSLVAAELPLHAHPVPARAEAGTQSSPANAVWAASAGTAKPYTQNAPNASMSANAFTPAGNGHPHENMMPFQAVSFIIATDGVYPPQN